MTAHNLGACLRAAHEAFGKDGSTKAIYIHKSEIVDYEAKGWKVDLMIGGRYGASSCYLAWRDDCQQEAVAS